MLDHNEFISNNYNYKITIKFYKSQFLKGCKEWDNTIFDNCTYGQIIKLIDFFTVKSEINKYYIFRKENEIELVKVKDLSNVLLTNCDKPIYHLSVSEIDIIPDYKLKQSTYNKIYTNIKGKK